MNVVVHLSVLAIAVEGFLITRKPHLSSCASLGLTVQGESGKLVPAATYETIASGRIAVIPNFLPPEDVLHLRNDAQRLHSNDFFSRASDYGTTAKLDPAKDRAVLRLGQWKDSALGDWTTRQQVGYRMAAVRSDLAKNLGRPRLDQGLSATQYGHGSTEISYTRFGPGAFLKRHVDEHHEELKGRAGWLQPTRRSLSWLIYLNEDWDGQRDGGQLRCFERLSTNSLGVGARPNGDLQIGWLRSSAMDPVERPVFLDGQQGDSKCAMYIEDSFTKKTYITDKFDSHPYLYMAGGESLTKKMLVNRKDLADRFHFIEPPKSILTDFLGGKSDYDGSGQNPEPDERITDIDPVGGTLVMFDAVCLPHEVLATKSKQRWAVSGWFHEDQQPIETRDHPV